MLRLCWGERRENQVADPSLAAAEAATLSKSNEGD
eukprot:COSAG05_NODE_24462_length_251_cov_0.684211_1_plen_34_part_10